MTALCPEFSKTNDEKDVDVIAENCNPDVSGDIESLCRIVGYNPRDDSINTTGQPVARGGNVEADCNSDNDGDGSKIDKDDCGIISYLQDFINLLSAVVAIVIVIMFAVRGIEFMTARDNAQQVSHAKLQIFWLVVALVVYIFSFVILQWLVPGGLF